MTRSLLETLAVSAFLETGGIRAPSEVASSETSVKATPIAPASAEAPTKATVSAEKRT
ncbi:hypothetical protein CRES_0695 [Corynebacterium resistens DSM 45100]|uniref:Uncharacterized protein n=1 Tax=Corynebacterium resistens (strain DSM 45100 / JCM 12819 / GTC 2026 / SICGH 158) TaxID=662755 RepID=F8DZF8_CORRG|nr:hypothetical protein CRES_0695 [Corynebacterium resistens DSM 45100]